MACKSEFCPVTLISDGNPNHFAESQPRIISTGLYSKGSLSPINTYLSLEAIVVAVILAASCLWCCVYVRRRNHSGGAAVNEEGMIVLSSREQDL